MQDIQCITACWLHANNGMLHLMCAFCVVIHSLFACNTPLHVCKLCYSPTDIVRKCSHRLTKHMRASCSLLEAWNELPAHPGITTLWLLVQAKNSLSTYVLHTVGALV